MRRKLGANHTLAARVVHRGDEGYGDQAGFEETLEDVEAAVPGILDAVTERGSAT